jgi:glycosyltransferase involved in cell wall biosynthesis
VPAVTVTVITKNEGGALAGALRSVAWANEIIVVDAESTDDTVAVARQFTTRVYVRRWNGYVDQKNHAASLAANNWILSLDADERVPPELGREIQALVAAEPPFRAYRMRRVSRYFGRWIRTTDMYPDYQLRLYDRRRDGPARTSTNRCAPTMRSAISATNCSIIPIAISPNT